MEIDNALLKPNYNLIPELFLVPSFDAKLHYVSSMINGFKTSFAPAAAKMHYVSFEIRLVPKLLLYISS